MGEFRIRNPVRVCDKLGMAEVGNMGIYLREEIMVNAHLERALFLDRDGVINVDKIDVHRKEAFEFIDGIFDVCRAAQQHGYKIIVITNQSGVARGVYTEADVRMLHEYMVGEFAKNAIEITDVYVCMSHDNSHEDRKPNPGMLLKAQEKHGLDMASSILVGDHERDILAGINAHCGKTILLTDDIDVTTSASIKVTSLLEILQYLLPVFPAGFVE
ncbi:MAG: HAD family hydrolase [Holosporales bacterium]|jgi:D-glycero-D-manno-heptose 1,7-bisphosphate phosphatase|nr:HAD family hydrolase [Holosporales bacterium]